MATSITTVPPRADGTLDPSSGAYCRSRSSLRDAAAAAVHDSYTRTPDAATFLFPSGMSAIASAFQAAVMAAWQLGRARHQVQVILPDEVYCDVPGVAKMLSALCGVPPPVLFEAGRTESLLGAVHAAAAPGAYVILFTETASNPSMLTCDWQAVNDALLPHVEAADDLHARVLWVMDNSWFTGRRVDVPALWPRVDVVVDSLSKHYTAGKSIGGALRLVTRCAPLLSRDHVIGVLATLGLHVAPEVCRAVLDAAAHVEARYKNAANALSAAVRAVRTVFPKFLVQALHPLAVGASAWLYYNPPAVCAFVVHVDAVTSGSAVGKKHWKKAMAAAAADVGLPVLTSYGKAYHLLDTWPATAGRTLRVRVSAGYDPEEKPLPELLVEFFRRLVVHLTRAQAVPGPQ